MDDLNTRKVPQGVAIVKANLPHLGPSSRIISPRQFFGRGSQRPNLIPRIDSPSVYMAGVIGLCSAATIAYWAAVFRGEMQGNWEPLKFIQRNFVCSVDNVKSGRWWVILTCSTEHVQPWHLILNMYALWGIGRRFIRRFGAPAFLWTWLVSAITGSLGSLYWEKHKNSDHTPVIGAIGSSTGLFGLMSAECIFVLHVFFTVPFVSAPSFVWRPPAFWFGVSVFCLYFDFLPSIGHAGHLGGMAGGVASYFLFIRRMFRL